MRGLTPYRVELACPACGYDVRQTLADGFYICPECGATITEETCGRTEAQLLPGTRLLLYVIWLLPAASLALLLVAPPPVGLSLFIVAAILVYGSMCWVERWLGSSKPEVAAIGPAAAILVAELACLPVMAGVIVVYIVIELYRVSFEIDGSPTESA